MRVVAIDVHAEALDESEHCPDVGNVWKVVEAYRLIGEERRRDQGEGRVLITARCHGTPQWRAPFDDEFVHSRNIIVQRGKSLPQ